MTTALILILLALSLALFAYALRLIWCEHNTPRHWRQMRKKSREK